MAHKWYVRYLTKTGMSLFDLSLVMLQWSCLHRMVIDDVSFISAPETPLDRHEVTWLKLSVFAYPRKDRLTTSLLRLSLDRILLDRHESRLTLRLYHRNIYFPVQYASCSCRKYMCSRSKRIGRDRNLGQRHHLSFQRALRFVNNRRKSTTLTASTYHGSFQHSVCIRRSWDNGTSLFHILSQKTSKRSCTTNLLFSLGTAVEVLGAWNLL